MITISYFYDLLESIGNCLRLNTCGFIFRAHARLPPNAKFGLSDWSWQSSGLIYVCGFALLIFVWCAWMFANYLRQGSQVVGSVISCIASYTDVVA